LKNHSKSQKNHKIENPIVLDSKWVHLHNEHTIPGSSLLGLSWTSRCCFSLHWLDNFDNVHMAQPQTPRTGVPSLLQSPTTEFNIWIQPVILTDSALRKGTR
jgi:hypothetical protein